MSIELAPRIREGRGGYILITLLLAHLVLISLQIEDPSGTLLFKRWMLVACTPFFSLSSNATRLAGGAWNNYLWLLDAREENRQLHEAVRQLSLRESALVQAERESERLRRLLAFRELLPLHWIGARVVGWMPGYLSNVMYVDRGSAEGVQEDAPVLADGGILGRAILVARNYSQVQLITNTDASVGAMIERTRSPGVIRGAGNLILDLAYIGNTEQVEVGDRVITSGLDGIFPKGLPIGKVVGSDKGKSGFRKILVKPYADLTHVEEVLVLLGAAKEITP